jgi:DNA-binding transcriptional regulator GbsR (MarR family)
LYSALYGRNWTVPELHIETGMSRDSIYSRLTTLIERGKVKRVKVKGHFQYYQG